MTPRGLNRSESAEYIGVGTTLWDELVADGKMPKPKQIKARRVWDRFEIDVAFTELHTTESFAEDSSWDVV